MAVANSTNVRIYVDGSVVNCETSSSLTASRGTDSVVCKDTAESPTVSPGEVTWSVSGSAFMELAGADTSYADIMNALLAGTQVAIVYNTGGGTNYGGNGYVSDVTFTGDGVESQATFDFTITGDGELSAQ